MSKSEETSKNDGRKWNKRLAPKPISAKDKMLPAPRTTKAKSERVAGYGIKAMKEVFGGEKEYFQYLAEMAKKGNFNAMKLLLEYTYGKASDSIDKDTKVVNKQAPQITFNVTQVPEKLDQADIIDITPDE
jgi:hypothetical protein